VVDSDDQFKLVAEISLVLYDDSGITELFSCAPKNTDDAVVSTHDRERLRHSPSFMKESRRRGDWVLGINAARFRCTEI